MGSERTVRRSSIADGVYVRGSVNGVPVTFTADTGASRTILSTRAYEAIPKDKRPPLERAYCLVGAGGNPIKKAGKAKFSLSLGTLELEREVIVAEVEDDALLGYDILRGGESGPADILLSQNKILLEGVDVPVFQVGRDRKTRRVTVADDISVPGLAESVISVYVERYEEDDTVQADFIVEPVDNFRDNYPLQMAATLVDVNQGPTCKIRILNPFPSDFLLRQNAEIGRAERVERVVSVVAAAEDDDGQGNMTSVRRIRLGERSSPATNQFTRATEAEVPKHLVDLYRKSTAGKSDYEKGVVAGLLQKYQQSFSTAEWDLGLTHLAEHTIKTGDAPPIKQRPRRVPLAYAEEEKKAIDELLQKGVIQKSTSPWASPIVLVRKKNGSVRPCVDYRQVNALVKPDGFPLPRIQDCLDAVAGATYFSSFDLTSGYFQIPLKEEDVPKSAFCCKYGHFEMTRMPFGLNNSASTFQRTMEIALQGLQWETCLVYIDDIIVYGTTFEQHIHRVEQVLDRMKQAGLKLKPEKCNMLQHKVLFLGHVVSNDGVLPDPTNTSKIVDWPVPQNTKHVKQFVATASYYRRFVRDFATMARPLTELTKKDRKFEWGDACQTAFENLKRALTGPEVMGYPLNEGGIFYLDTDASGVGIGAVLSQMQKGRERVVAYASRSTNKAESNYCITEQELLAIVYFMQYFRQYLLGRHFVVRTDHQALVWLFKLKEPNGKIARWLEILSPYDFAVEYRKGQHHGNADGLSRCEDPRECHCHIVDMSEPLKCGPCAKCRRRAEIMCHSEIQCGGPEVSVSDDLEDACVLMDADVVPKTPTGETVTAKRTLDEEDVPEGATEGAGALSKPIVLKIETPLPAIARALTVDDEQEPGPSNQGDEISRANWTHTYSLTELGRMQDEDASIGPVLRAKRAGVKPKPEDIVAMCPETRHYFMIWDSLRTVDAVVYRSFCKLDQTDNYTQLIVPRVLREEVLRGAHEPVTAGHMGVKRTKGKLARNYYWFEMKQDVELHIRCCDVCEADKKPPKTPRAPMGHVRTGAPWDIIALDFMGPFPVTSRGNRHILVLTDLFTKYIEVVPVPSQTAEQCAKIVVDHVVNRWGTPLAIHSDQGTAFESRLFKELCELLAVKKTRTSARNPQGNGQVERANRTIVKMVRAFLSEEQDDWDVHLGCIANAYRATPHQATKLSPNMLALGREVRLPADLQYPTVRDSDEHIRSEAEYIVSLRQTMQRAHEVARTHLGKEAERSKEVYDRRLAFTKYKVGDIVWCLHETRRVGVNPKLQKAFDGPFVITESRSALNHVVQLDKRGAKRLLHHNKLKLYRGKTAPKWASQLASRLRTKE